MLLLVIIAALWPGLAGAGLAERQIDQVALAPVRGARVPTSLMFKDLQARPTTLAEAIANRPTLLLPADFTCRQICGPALAIAAAALAQTGLTAGRDYSLVVVGIDAKDGIDAARNFVSGQVGGAGVSVLTGDSAAIKELLDAIGYRFARDDDNHAIAHPAAVLTLSAEGRVVRALSSLALQPTDLKLALLEAGRGSIGGVAGRIALLCYGFDAVHGIYTRKVGVVLEASCVATLLVMAGAIGLMLVRSRRRGVAT
jgi:protein SCO1/2